MNCSIYPRVSVPVDMTPVFNMYRGNDSHVEYANSSTYDYSVACKSNITALNVGCSNNFLSVMQIYNYTDAHISVDNYYDRNICLNTSNMSLIWQSSITAIGATPANYECLFSMYNYSNSHVYTCDSTNATYNYNVRLEQTDTNIPTGSIIIVGPNGTIITGTKSVFLNLTYDDDTSVDKCRWANDNEANLTNSPWENCTSVKAWILSEGEGNKTVWYQIRDNGGKNVNISDSILYYESQDYSPPTAPIVYDSLGNDIDWYNSNNSLSANWWNSTDETSNVIYYSYRIMINNSVCYNTDCNWTDVNRSTEVTVSNLKLKENSHYSFQIKASVGGAYSIGSSNGTNIDLTKPDKPIINSTTHPVPGTPSASTTAAFNWTAIDPLSNNNRSGIATYSYIIDTHPGTAPDDLPEERYWDQLASLRLGSYNQTLKDNITGAAYAVFSQLKANFTENESIKVKTAIAEQYSDYDDLLDLSVYIIRVNQGTQITTFDQGTLITDPANTSTDIAYSEYMSDADTYSFNLTINETVNDNTYDFYVVIKADRFDDDNTQPHAIAGTQSNVDSNTSLFVCDEYDNCYDQRTTHDYAIEVKRQSVSNIHNIIYSGLPDGIHYFHVKAKDRAGNWGETAHYKIIVASGGVSIAIAYPENGDLFESENSKLNISVKVMVSDTANVRIIAVHPDGGNYTSPIQQVDTTLNFQDILLHTGQNRIFAIANTSAGAITTSSDVYVMLQPSYVPIANKTLRVKIAGCGNSPGSQMCRVSGIGPGGNYIMGAASENPYITGDEIWANTDRHSMKIFVTRTFDFDKPDEDLADDEFLDNKNPSFGFGDDSPSYLMQDELRYDDIYLTGLDHLSPGKYNLYINHHGVTEDGKVNLSITVGE